MKEIMQHHKITLHHVGRNGQPEVASLQRGKDEKKKLLRRATDEEQRDESLAASGARRPTQQRPHNI